MKKLSKIVALLLAGALTMLLFTAPAGHLAAVRGWDAPASGALWLRGFQVPSGEPRRQRPAHNIHPNLSGLSLPQKQGSVSGVWQEMSDGKDSLRSPV